MAWLDEQQKASREVLYVAFGSEADRHLGIALCALSLFCVMLLLVRHLWCASVEVFPSHKVRVSKTHAVLLAETFKAGGFTVLWASKVKPDVALPDSVLVTRFAPQRAVLAHPAVFGFLSHGGMNSVNEALAFGKPLAIMPFFGDQMMVAVVHRELGVAVVLDKLSATPEDFVAAIRKIATEPFRRRSWEIKELNDQRRDMSRAVQVIVNQATGKFHLHIPPCPSLWIRLMPLFIGLIFWAVYCDLCCCIRVHVHKPWWCCCCRGRALPPKPAGSKKNQ